MCGLRERIRQNEIEVRALFCIPRSLERSANSAIWSGGFRRYIQHDSPIRQEDLHVSNFQASKDKEMMFARLIRVPDTVSGSCITANRKKFLLVGAAAKDSLLAPLGLFLHLR